MPDPTDTTEASTPPPGAAVDDDAAWAVVEIMGHRTRAGRISEQTVAGAPMLRIEHPTAVDHTGAPLIELYAPTALFSLRPCTPKRAESVAAAWWRTEERTALPPSYPDADMIDDDLDDVDDEDLDTALCGDDGPF